MKAGGVTPTGVERSFGAEEIIVSKTNAKGVITYVNDVFVRVSAYSRGQLIGSPHSLIRHPQMPRGVFRLMWDTIGAGEEIFAYVDNLAADGANYWVLAHVTPSFDRSGRIVGYHSNRRRPEPSAVRKISQVYQSMTSWEGTQTGRAAEIAAESARRLAEQLAEQSMTYDEYVWDLINTSAGEAA